MGRRLRHNSNRSAAHRQNPGQENCWAVLGFGGNGITCSRIAADIIRVALAGKSDPDADLYAFR